MIPFAVLAASFCVCLLIGFAGNHYLADYRHALRVALAMMFLLTHLLTGELNELI